MECKSRLERYFRENGVPFQVTSHSPVFTAPEMAAVQHVPGKQVAKVVMARAHNSMVMLVLPANAHVNFETLAALLQAPEARLAHEDEFNALFSDCMIGAMPPFGNLYGVPVYLDRSLTDDPEILFCAGTHTDTMRIRFSDYVKLVKPEIADFSV